MNYSVHVYNYTAADMDELLYNTENVTKDIENVT